MCRKTRSIIQSISDFRKRILILIFALPQIKRSSSSFNAEVAHLVEHDLAKVGVAGSSPVFRSRILPVIRGDFF